MINTNKLIKLAIQEQKNSYSPYSKFPVGAALLTKNGKVFYGTNIENASYSLTICAERVAVFSAYANGIKKNDIKAIAISTNTEIPSPCCGACLQTLSELIPLECPIYLVNKKGTVIETNIKKCLPNLFKKDDLKI